MLSSSYRSKDSSGPPGMPSSARERPVTASSNQTLLDECRVLDQTQQGGLRAHQRSTRLLLGQAVEARIQRRPVLVEERLELHLRGFVDDVLGGMGFVVRHRRIIARHVLVTFERCSRETRPGPPGRRALTGC